MPISFPVSPTNGQVFTSGTRTWTYNSTKGAWVGGNISPLTFTNIVVSGQGAIVADSPSDTLTLFAGSGILLTTDPTNDTLSIASNPTSANNATAGIVPTLGATGFTVTGAPTRRQMLIAITNQFTARVPSYGTSASSGTGTAFANTSTGTRVTTTTSAGVRAPCETVASVTGIGNNSNTPTDWSQTLIGSGHMTIAWTGTPATDTRIRMMYGGKGGASVGTLAARGFVIEAQWNGTAMEIFCGVHNGTTLNLQTTSLGFSTANGTGVLWSFEADGTGNVNWFVSVGGASAATANGKTRNSISRAQTGAPTGTESATRFGSVEVNNGVAGGAAMTVDFMPMTFAFGV